VGHQADHLSPGVHRRVPRSGAEIEEHEGLTGGVNTHAGGVAPEARRLLAVAGSRAAHPVEGHRDRLVSDARTL